MGLFSSSPPLVRKFMTYRSMVPQILQLQPVVAKLNDEGLKAFGANSGGCEKSMVPVLPEHWSFASLIHAMQEPSLSFDMSETAIGAEECNLAGMDAGVGLRLVPGYSQTREIDVIQRLFTHSHYEADIYHVDNSQLNNA